jgi:hypothetical protein
MRRSRSPGVPGFTLVVASLLGLAFVGWKGPKIPFSNYETT